jgi:hypothetical protein
MAEGWRGDGSLSDWEAMQPKMHAHAAHGANHSKTIQYMGYEQPVVNVQGPEY